MQSEDDAREAHIAEWRNKNADRQRRGMQPVPYRPMDAPTTEPVKLRDHIRRQQAAAGGSPFKVTEV